MQLEKLSRRNGIKRNRKPWEVTKTTEVFIRISQ